jgi:hypothetical protein
MATSEWNLSFRSKLVYISAIMLVGLVPFSEFLWPHISKESVLKGAHRVHGMENYLDREILYKSNPIDIAILGSSHVQGGINAAVLKSNLESKLKRPLSITHLTIQGMSHELQYFVLDEILKRRKIKFLLFDIPATRIQKNANPSTCFLMFYPHWQGILEKMSLTMRFKMHVCSIASAPRLITSYFDKQARSEGGIPMSQERLYGGALLGRTLPRPLSPRIKKFAESIRIDDSLHFAGSRSLAFLKQNSNFNTLMAIETMELAKRHGVHPVLVRFPRIHHNGKIPMLEQMREYLTLNEIPIIGLERNILNRVPRLTYRQLFKDSVHLNQIGNFFWTHMITDPIKSIITNLEK